MKKKPKTDDGNGVYKVEAGIQIPVQLAEMTKETRTMMLLKAKESFFIANVDGKEAERTVKRVQGVNKRLKKRKDDRKFTGRKVDGGVRIWRVK